MGLLLKKSPASSGTAMLGFPQKHHLQWWVQDFTMLLSPCGHLKWVPWARREQGGPGLVLCFLCTRAKSKGCLCLSSKDRCIPWGSWSLGWRSLSVCLCMYICSVSVVCMRYVCISYVSMVYVFVMYVKVWCVYVYVWYTWYFCISVEHEWCVYLWHTCDVCICSIHVIHVCISVVHVWYVCVPWFMFDICIWYTCDVWVFMVHVWCVYISGTCMIYGIFLVHVMCVVHIWYVLCLSEVLV